MLVFAQFKLSKEYCKKYLTKKISSILLCNFFKFVNSKYQIILEVSTKFSVSIILKLIDCLMYLVVIY